MMDSLSAAAKTPKTPRYEIRESRHSHSSHLEGAWSPSAPASSPVRARDSPHLASAAPDYKLRASPRRLRSAETPTKDHRQRWYADRCRSTERWL
jgi:hypothetical protein